MKNLFVIMFAMAMGLSVTACAKKIEKRSL